VFVSPPREFDNVILTAHVGGSTEAQANIGVEVARLIKHSNNASTVSAVKFPSSVAAGASRQASPTIYSSDRLAVLSPSAPSKRVRACFHLKLLDAPRG